MTIIISERRKAIVNRRKALIAIADIRLLTRDEEAELAFLWWNGSKESFVQTLNEAYATAKQYERFGGAALRAKLDAFQHKLNSDSFELLFHAKRLFCQAEK